MGVHWLPILAVSWLTALAAGDPAATPCPCDAAWKDVVPARFDTSWTLPAPDLPAGEELLARAEAAAAWRLDPPLRPDGLEGPACTTLGDLLTWSRGLPSGRRAARIAALPLPEALAETLADDLRALLDDGDLRDDDWDPSDDTDADGLLTGPAWELPRGLSSRWDGLEGSRAVHQAVTLAAADPLAVKRAENDFPSYFDRRHSGYEAIHALPGSCLAGVDAAHGAFLVLSMYVRCDLPFPFDDYEVWMDSLTRRDAADRFVTDVHARRGDFLWMAGRDVLVPVPDGDGTVVGTLIVRRLGFDIGGVPDGDRHRRASLRGGLGNLKLRAEELFRRPDRGAALVDLPFPPAAG